MADSDQNQPSQPPDLDDAEDDEVDAAIDPEATETAEEPTESKVEPMSLDGAADELPPTAVANGVEEPEIEARISAKKDATLREFLNKMDDYAPIIPDAVTNYYLTLAGLPPPPATHPHLARLLALATQKFVADVATDAYQYARIRSSHTTSNTANAMMAGSVGLPGQVPGAAGASGAAGGAAGGKEGEKGGKGGLGLGVQRPGFGGGGQGTAQGRTVLTMEDLGMAVGEYGVNVKRGEFYR